MDEEKECKQYEKVNELSCKLNEQEKRLVAVESKASITENNVNNLIALTEKNFENFKDLTEEKSKLQLAQIENLIIKENKKLKDDYDNDRIVSHDDNRKALRNAVISILVALTITVLTVVLNLK